MPSSSISKLLAAAFLSLIAAASAAELKPQKNIAAGNITLEGGKPIQADVEDYLISLYGVSEAGEKVRYSPAVKNGAYRQKLVPGQYAFHAAKMKVKFGETVFLLPLEPVGKLWNKNQDAEEGIVQHFVWKPTGQANTYGRTPDPNNHTHWYGMSVGLMHQGWRSDLKKASAKLPAGTKLVFTVTPLSRSIDGRELKPRVIELDWKPDAVTPNNGLHDLPPANYEISGVAKLPDGSTRPILLQGRGHYPNFVEKISAPLELDKITGSYWKQLVGWATE